jgi:hypothetical protein
MSIGLQPRPVPVVPGSITAFNMIDWHSRMDASGSSSTISAPAARRSPCSTSSFSAATSQGSCAFRHLLFMACTIWIASRQHSSTCRPRHGTPLRPTSAGCQKTTREFLSTSMAGGDAFRPPWPCYLEAASPRQKRCPRRRRAERELRPPLPTFQCAPNRAATRQTGQSR